jgi:hypothetical protein
MQVKAKIVDENNEPLVGVNVVVLDRNNNPTNVGDATDFDGNFTINNVAINSITTLLKISYLGYNTVVVPVASIVATKGVVKMSPDTTILDGTTVYGTKKNKFNWLWLLLIPASIGVYQLTKEKPKKVIL